MSSDALPRSVTGCLHNPESGVLFECWFKYHEDVFTVEFVDKDSKTKVGLFLQKLGPAEHMKYNNFIFPDETTNRTKKNVNAVKTPKPPTPIQRSYVS